MRNLKTILVDDEKDSREALEYMLLRYNKPIEIVARCRSADEAVEQIQQYEPDLVCLDIEMPGKDGFEVLAAFDNPKFKVIVITGYEHYALKAIKYAALDFLLKPIEMSELFIALEKVEKAFDIEDPRLRYFNEQLKKEKEVSKIILSTYRGFKNVAISEILYVEAGQGNYSNIHLLNDRQEVVTKPLNHFEELLPSDQFYRVHRSHLVNLSRISHYERSKGEVVMAQDYNITVAARRRADFYKAYKEFLT